MPQRKNASLAKAMSKDEAPQTNGSETCLVGIGSISAL